MSPADIEPIVSSASRIHAFAAFLVSADSAVGRAVRVNIRRSLACLISRLASAERGLASRPVLCDRFNEWFFDVDIFPCDRCCFRQTQCICRGAVGIADFLHGAFETV